MIAWWVLAWIFDWFSRFLWDFTMSRGIIFRKVRFHGIVYLSLLDFILLFNNNAQFISINLIKITIPSPLLSHVYSTDYTLLYTLQIKMQRRQCIIAFNMWELRERKIYDGVILTHSEHYKSVKMWFETMVVVGLV